MIDFKNDLYRTEWLELVFAGRNKAYGAYELRLHNSSTTLKALFAGLVVIALGISAPFIYSRLVDHNPGSGIIDQDTDLRVVQFSALPKYKSPQAPAVANQQKRKMPVRKFVPMLVVPAVEATDELPSVKELKSNTIGQETVNGNPNEGTENPLEASVETDVQKTLNSSAEDPTVNMSVLESYPEFPGGQSAFNKFIGRNLRYPAMARDNKISGRVFVSFVIEKDGSLSNIRIIRAIGGGCEEEAIRVLKKSPSWSSGIQNGRKVRVEYTMPIYFQLDE